MGILDRAKELRNSAKIYLNVNDLDTVKNWYFHLYSIDAINEKLLEDLEALELPLKLPNFYRRNQNELQSLSQ